MDTATKPPADAPNPTEASKSQGHTPPPANTPGVLILQWLTYAFWGWLLLGLIWLMSVILANAITGADVSGVVPYAVAATIVMLPIAFVTDLFYRKYEPPTKTGVATVLMVIHAVIFALFGIGMLITSVFVGLNALINIETDSDIALVIVLVTLFATIMYAAAFLRTLNPFKKPVGARIYAFSMLGAAVLLLALAIIGPIVTTVATRNDRLIESNLSGVESAVQDYARDTGKLPASLDDITIRDKDARSLVKNGEVRYQPMGTDTTDATGVQYLRYQLCVTYDRANDSEGYESYYTEDEYTTYARTVPHDEGEVCYKLRTAAPSRVDALKYSQ